MKKWLTLPLLVLPLLAINVHADALGSADTYAVLATTQVTNATTFGDTVITGDMGAVSCTGFVPSACGSAAAGTISGALNLSNGAYATALADSNAAYVALGNSVPTTSLSATSFDLGGSTLAPGVYSIGSTAGLTGTLTLNGGANLNPLWIFQIGTGLTTASDSSLVITGAGAASAGVYFRVGSAATLGDNTAFQGNILAGTAISFDPGAQITCGRAFTDTAGGTAVTFAGDNPAAVGGRPNIVTDSCVQSSSGFNGGVIATIGDTPQVVAGSLAPVPEPGTWLLLGSGFVALLGMARMKRVSTEVA